jgi:homocysteine S-methyltransferase
MNPRSRRFLDEMQERVFVCDGAMGTMLYSKGIPITSCFEEMNLSMPSLVKEVHEGYRKAGAEILEANTFGANRRRLSSYGLEEKCREINRAGVRLARECAGDDALVAGAVGPLGVRLAPLGPLTPDEARRAFAEQFAALADAGADLILLETFYDFDELQEAIAAARAACDLPLLAQVTIDDDGNMPSGTRPEDFTAKLLATGVDAIGLNCSVGPKVMLDAIQRMAPLSSAPLTAQPNAGLPMNIGGRNIYLCSPEYMAGYVSHFIRAGVKLVGGCCGTTPEHIRAVRDAVRAAQFPRPHVAAGAVASRGAAARTLEPVPLAQRSRLGRKLAQGEFVVLAEIAPSRGCDPGKEIEGASYLAASGIDAAYVPEVERASGRISAQALAQLIQSQAKFETVLQYSCRDRNIVSIQSDLLGAHALGIRNVALLTGELPTTGDFPDATAVFDVDSIGLTKIVANLNRGLDIGGNFLGNQTKFVIAILGNPTAADMHQEWERLEAKARLGAECIVTLPVFDLERLDPFLERVQTWKLPVLATVHPLTSYRNAEFLANESQIAIPKPILDRMKAVESGEAARAEGIRIAQELVSVLRSRVQGIRVTTPLGRYGTVVEVLQALGSPVAQGASASGKTGESG